jgi:hypothetical protein
MGLPIAALAEVRLPSANAVSVCPSTAIGILGDRVEEAALAKLPESVRPQYVEHGWIDDANAGGGRYVPNQLLDAFGSIPDVCGGDLCHLEICQVLNILTPGFLQYLQVCAAPNERQCIRS